MFKSPEKQMIPAGYFGPGSGIECAFYLIREKKNANKIGAIGMGAGVISAFLQNADKTTFFELNPAVVFTAKNYFSFINNSLSKKINIIEGDGRLNIVKFQDNFDLLLIDAFTGDAIPAHLLTDEAFKIYLTKIENDGLIIFHISNRHIDLVPVMKALALSNNMNCYIINQSVIDDYRAASTYALFSEKKINFNLIKNKYVIDFANKNRNLKSILWTDKYSNLFSLIKM